LHLNLELSTFNHKLSTILTKIFITIPWFLPAFRAGGPIQSIANLVREFHQDIEYFIFCGDTDLNGGELANIITGEWISYNDYTKVWYAQPDKVSDSLVTQVEEIKPDILYIIGIFSWHYNIVPLLYCKAPKKILSTRGMLHPGALSQKKWKKRIYLEIFKLLKQHRKVYFHATDEEENKYINKYLGEEATIFIAGNFSNKIDALAVAEKEAGNLKLVSIALISPMKNILMILTAMDKCSYAVEYNIYGPVKDSGYWELCKEKIKTLPGNIRVNYYKEIVPQRVKEVLMDAHVFILPSKSENFGHAIYEALSAGRPVITSNNTPWNKLQENHAGMNISLANDMELLESINFFAEMRSDELIQWSKCAHEYAEKAIDMDKIKEEYEKMFLR
jgi:glycosyltransferase involved in cell wall biosynthesis